MDLVRSLRADAVIDYTVADFTAGEAGYDVILDNVGNRSLEACRRVLVPRGTLMPNSGTGGGPVLGPLPRTGRAAVESLFTHQRLKTFLSLPNPDDLQALRDLVSAGSVRPVISSRYRLEDAAQAMRVVTGGHTSGKVVISVAGG